jgi:ribulose-5-phosphate 4-epimerase/fuculose-1-phosphate aldolase
MTAERRTAVVDAAREMLRLGLVTGTSGNLSARDGRSFLITPASMPYEQMDEADLVAIDSYGEPGEGGGEPSSEWRVHVAIYAARPDVDAIVHTHSVHATAWSFRGEPLDTGTEELEAAAGGPVLTAPFAPTGSDEIAAAAANALGDRRAVLLGRHGAVGVGATPQEALATCVVLERQAEIAWLVRR